MSIEASKKPVPAAPPQRSSSSSPTSGQRPLVLVIDDDESILESLDLLLSSRYKVILCRSAREGVDAFSEDVLAVILDVKMSGQNGFWACDELRALVPDIPVIFFSAYQDAKDPYQIMNDHRPFGYISKSAAPQKLIDILETAVVLYQTTLRSRRIIRNLKLRSG